MTRLLLRWLLLAAAVYLSALICQALGFGFVVNVHSAGGVISLLIGVAIWGLLNATLGRILKLLTLPLSCITLGLFSLVVNAVVLIIAADFDIGFQIVDHGIKKFITAFVASLLIAFVSGILGIFLPEDED